MAITNFDTVTAAQFIGALVGSVSGAANVTTVLLTLGSITIFAVAGVPSAQAYGKGSIGIDTTNANIYINAGTAGTPDYKLITRAA